MADVAVVSLEIQSARLLSGVQQSEAALKRLEQAGDRVSASSKRTDQATNQTSVAMRKAAQEAAALAQADARLLRAQGDYSGAVQVLEKHLKSLSVVSVEYVRVQAQMVQIQNQAGRALRGETFAGFAAQLKDINSNLTLLPGRFGSVAARVQGVTAALGEMTTASAGTIAAVGGVGAAIAAVAVGLGIGATKLIEFALSGAKAADDLTDLAQILGVSPGFLEKLGVAYSLAGKNVQDAQSTITKFEANLGQAASGNAPKLAKAFLLLGVDAKKSGGDVEGALTKVLAKLGETTDQTGLAAVAAELFGKKGLELVKIHKDLADKTSDLNIRMAKFGLVVGTDGLNAAAKLADAQDALGIAFSTTAKIVAAQLSPTLVKLIDQFLELFVKAKPAIEATATALGGILSGLGAIVSFVSSHKEELKFFALFGGFGAGGIVGGAAALIAGGKPKSGIDFTVPGAGHEGAGPPGAARSGPRRGDAVTNPQDARLKAILDALGGGGGGGATAKAGKLDDATKFAVDLIEAARRLKREGIGPLADTIISARDDIEAFNAILAKVPPTSQKAAQTTDALAKAVATLSVAEDKFLKDTADALTAANRKVPLATGPAPSLAGFGGIPGTAGFRSFDDFKKLLHIGEAPGGITRGQIPGQPDFADAPRPPSGLTGLKQQLFGRTTGTGEKIEGAGVQITQEFLRGILSGQQGLREAGANLAQNFSNFFADYTARKLTEYTSKALNKAFDYIGGLIGGLFKKIFSGLGGGGGGIIGSLLGAFGSIFGLSHGGYAAAGHPYLVGERGPELFRPRESGYVVPNSQISQSGGSSPANYYITMHINTPDVGSFKKSQDQVMGDLLRKLDNAERNR